MIRGRERAIKQGEILFRQPNTGRVCIAFHMTDRRRFEDGNHPSAAQAPGQHDLKPIRLMGFSHLPQCIM
jgi:hypothetical protein